MPPRKGIKSGQMKNSGGGLGGASNIRAGRSSSASGSRSAAAKGGIGAKGGARQRPGNAPSSGPAAKAAATGTTQKGAFGVTSGSSKPLKKGQGKTPLGASTAATTPPGFAGVVGVPRGRDVLGEGYVPSHTFAASTMPRANKTSTPNHGMNNPATSSDDSDADDTKLKKKTTGDASTPLADTPRQPGASSRPTPDDLQRPPYHLATGMGFKAAAAAAAKSAGVSPQAGAAMVAAASQNASKKAKAKNPNLKRVPSKGSKQQPGGTYS